MTVFICRIKNASLPGCLKNAGMILISIVFFCLNCAQADVHGKVLFINSYHPGFPTFFEQVNGLKDAFAGKNILLDVEFMDTKRFPDQASIRSFRETLSRKLSILPRYDVVIAGDDNALLFVIKEQNDLFKGLPMVFFGVNNLELARKQDENPNITGVVETVSMMETIQLMESLKPRSKKIIAIVDGTTSGQSDLSTFYQLGKKFKNLSFSHVSLENLSWQEFEEKIEGLDPDSSVLLLSAYRDKNNVCLQFNDSLALIKKRGSFPLYHLWFHGIGEGVLGGKVISHFKQGNTAGKIAVEILNGKPVGDIKVVSKNAGRYVFDHGELGRQKIPMALLPEQSVVLNKPETFYEKNKSLFWPLGSVFMVLFLALVSALADIRSHRKNQRQLRDSVDSLETIFNSTPNILFLLNGEGRVEDVNYKGVEFIGKTKEDVVGLLVGDVFCCLNISGTGGDCDFECVEYPIDSLISDTFKTGTNHTREEGQLTFQLNGESVSMVFLISTSRLVISGARKVLFCLADITERKQNEDRIRKSRARYQTIMDTMEYPICIVSQAFVIEYLNSHMIRRIGYDARGEKCFKAIHGFDTQCSWCDYGKNKLTESRQINIISPLDNRSFDVSTNTLVNDDGSVSILHVFRDVTEIKQMEKKLYQAQKMEAIGLLAGGIAHDFNNILSPIIGYTQILLEENSEDELLQSSLDEILTASMRAKELVKQILTFSRQGSDEMRPLKVQSIVKETLKLIRSSIPKSIEIVENIQTDCGLIKADPTHIHQILMNLTTNAYHAMEEIGGKIEIKVQEIILEGNERTGVSFWPGKYVLMSITDNGCGIPRSCRDKIFEPYFTTKEKHKGTGLGLSILYGIVKECRGYIDFSSEVGKGTTFNVYLPLIKMGSQSESGQETKNFQGGTEKILLVDDEAPILRFQKQMLERLGYKVSERSSSVDALQAFKADIDSFDLVITDMSMPNMSGEQLAVKILAIRPDIPVIICSGFSEKMNGDLSKTIGVKGFLMKPVIKSVMTKEVRRILDEYRLSKKTIS